MLKAIDHAFRIFLAGLMGLLVVAVTWQVLSRYLLAEPSSWTEELARFLLVWIGVLGASYAYRMKMHLGIDLLPQHLTGMKYAVLELVINLAVIVFAVAVMIIGGGNLVSMTAELKQVSPALGIPMAWVYAVVPLSGMLIVLYALENTLESWQGKDRQGSNEHG